MEQTKAFLRAHCARYPALTVQDVLKALHQSSFGCGHLVENRAAAVDFIRRETASCPDGDVSLREALCGGFCRVHLAAAKRMGLAPETLGAIFALSAAAPCDGAAGGRCEVFLELCRAGELPFELQSVEAEIAAWCAAGYPARRHSEVFRAAYAPAYRVLWNRHAWALPLFAAIDRKLAEAGRAVVAVEGGAGSGKSTLAQLLKEVYDCTVFHMDDFFLRPEQRTAERYAEVGGNIDHERFLAEVLQPLRRGEAVDYRPFDCGTFTVQPPRRINPAPLVIVEGAYSMHPKLAAQYDLTAFLDISPALQRRRIESRNSPEFARRFFEEWIPLERIYFEATGACERCDVILEVEE